MSLSWLKLGCKRDWRYRLSRFVPMRMRSSYDVVSQDAYAEGGVIEETGRRAETASWWQWRGHVYRARVVRVDAPAGGV